MPEYFDDMRNALFHDAGEVRWADPADVRRRGTQRAHRRVAVMGLVTALVIGGGAVAGAALAERDRGTPVPPATSSSSVTSPAPSPSGPPSPSPSASPSQRPSEPTVEIPDSALLQPEDAGPGYRIEHTEVSSGDWQIAALIGRCEYGRWTSSAAILRTGENRQLTHPAQPSIPQLAWRYESPSISSKYLADLRAILERCRDINLGGDGRFQLSIVDTGFAGEESILLQVEYSGGENFRYYAFLRQGNLVTEVGFGRGVGEEFARTVAERAAARLCTATPSC